MRATCTIPNFRHACWNARFLPGSPVVANVRVVSEVSTTLARNTLPSSTISGRCAGDARTLMSIEPRSTHILSVTFSTLRTFASLLICLMSFIASLSLAITTTVKMALSTFKPTARDSMLYPRRAGEDPRHAVDHARLIRDVNEHRLPAQALLQTRGAAVHADRIRRALPGGRVVARGSRRRLP